MKIVVAAVLRRNREILACRRRADQNHPGKWEFPGGKVEPGETPAQALQRELAEELNIDALIGAEITRYEYAYPGLAPIRLVFFEVESYQGTPSFSQFSDARWATPAELPALDFLDGDIDFVRKLASEA